MNFYIGTTCNIFRPIENFKNKISCYVVQRAADNIMFFIKEFAKSKIVDHYRRRYQMIMIDETLLRELQRKADEYRLIVLDLVYKKQTGHIGGSFSIAEVLTAMYWAYLKVDPLNPEWERRDRLLFSKGHACAMLYTVLADRGFFPMQELNTFRDFHSKLQGHPEPGKLPGIEIAAGPLGHGVAIGTGMALSQKLKCDKPSAFNAPSAKASNGRVFVILGDGELNAGVVWEGVMSAAKYKLGNLTVIVDYNGIQQTGATADVMPTDPIAEKWSSFGWYVQEINGHSIAEVLRALERADEVHARPSVIIARTTKGKGVSFMEYDHNWHGTPPDDKQYKEAKDELEKKVAKWNTK